MKKRRKDQKILFKWGALLIIVGIALIILLNYSIGLAILIIGVVYTIMGIVHHFKSNRKKKK